jgi:electron transfer flavoprotein alpha subunit
MSWSIDWFGRAPYSTTPADVEIWAGDSMRVAVVAEHDGQALRAASLSCFTFANAVANATGGDVSWFILGDKIDVVAAEAALFAPAVVVDSPLLARPLADSFARAIATVARERRFDLVCAASSTFSKDVLPRAAALMGGAMASDIVGHESTAGGLTFDCPQYAGAVTATIRLIGSPQVVTVRSSAYQAARPVHAERHSIERVELSEAAFASRCHYVGSKSKTNTRPDVTEARVVVSGGRALRNSEDFERLAGGLADVLGGAVGSSRALVDAGITPNELQVGQTGKIVAPELYIALGISGAVQHLAGMRNSRTIVAINSDPDAPIFDVADFGLVGDVYELVPELIEKLKIAARKATA